MPTDGTRPPGHAGPARRQGGAGSRTGGGASGGKLQWIEVGRGLAALVVVVQHYATASGDPRLLPLTHLGALAVEFFFVLSGFIIFHVHAKEAGQPSAIGRYVWRRWSRVFPVYWIILATAIAERPFQPTLRNIHLSGSEIANQFIIAPNITLLIGQAWTLRHELLFYAVFCVFFLHKRLGFAVFFGWMAAIAVGMAVSGLPQGQVSDPVGIVLHHYNLDFALGMATAVAFRQGRLMPMIGAASAAAAVLALCSYHTGDSIFQILFLKAVFAAVLAIAIVVSRRGIGAPAPLLLLGAASYSLYISHELIGSISKRAAAMIHLAPLQAVPVMVLVAVLFAVVFHLMVERPLLALLRHARWPFRRRGPRAIEA